MNIAVIVSLVVLGIVFILLELFFLPGISLASIGGLICFAAAVVLAYVKIGATAGTVTLMAALVATALCAWWFFRSKALTPRSIPGRNSWCIPATRGSASPGWHPWARS